MIALTLLAYLKGHGNTFLIEEPENGMHPKALQTIFDSLRSVYDGQVLLATHSPLLLSMATPEHLLCFARNRSGATQVIRGLDHPVLRSWRREASLDTLFAAGVLG